MKVYLSLLLILFSPLVNGDRGVAQRYEVAAIEPAYARANDINVAYKVLGEADDPAVVLVMGLAASHRLWGDDLPNRLVAAGYRVVLFDNRDVGQSQRFDEAGTPTIWWEFAKQWLGFEVNAAYSLADMAGDTVGLLDALEIDQAHVVGASMGGMIAQVIAARYPDRVLSLTSIMSTPGFADHLPPPGELNAFDDPDNDETEAQRKMRLERFGFYPDAMPRQLMAILKSGDRAEEVKTIATPTLVLHGKEDTLIPPEHGAYTAELIGGAKYMVFDGMGHNLPADVLPALVSAMIDHMQPR
jgi:pimeloyl-ACP methyl ester carboxylesterase